MNYFFISNYLFIIIKRISFALFWLLSMTVNIIHLYVLTNRLTIIIIWIQMLSRDMNKPIVNQATMIESKF